MVSSLGTSTQASSGHTWRRAAAKRLVEGEAAAVGPEHAALVEQVPPQDFRLGGADFHAPGAGDVDEGRGMVLGKLLQGIDGDVFREGFHLEAGDLGKGAEHVEVGIGAGAIIPVAAAVLEADEADLGAFHAFGPAALGAAAFAQASAALAAPLAAPFAAGGGVGPGGLHLGILHHLAVGLDVGAVEDDGAVGDSP